MGGKRGGGGEAGEGKGGEWGDSWWTGEGDTRANAKLWPDPRLRDIMLLVIALRFV